MTIYEELGLAGVINGVGPATRLGGLGLADEVWQAMRDAVSTPVHMSDLQRAAGEEISRLLGVPAAYVTSGASAALTLAAAVCMAGDDPVKINQLPLSTGMPHRFVMQQAQRDPYDRALEAAGGQLVEVGYPGTTHRGELEAALDHHTAAVFFRPGYPGNLLDLATVCRVAHDHGVPVIVDGALVVPLVPTLHRMMEAGVDLIAVSGGKALRGPQASGLLAGRPDLVAAAALHHQDMDERDTTWHRSPGTPPRHGIARGMKTGREQIAGLLAAVRRYVGNPDADNATGIAELDSAASVLGGDPRITVERRQHPHLNVPTLTITLPPDVDVDDMVRGLLALATPVHLGQERAYASGLTVNPMALQPGHGVRLAQSILDVLSSLD